MTINTIAASVDFSEDLKKSYSFSSFLKKLIFNENLLPKDDVTSKIWWHIFWTLSTKNSECLIGF